MILLKGKKSWGTFFTCPGVIVLSKVMLFTVGPNLHGMLRASWNWKTQLITMYIYVSCIFPFKTQATKRDKACLAVLQHEDGRNPHRVDEHEHQRIFILQLFQTLFHLDQRLSSRVQQYLSPSSLHPCPRKVASNIVQSCPSKTSSLAHQSFLLLLLWSRKISQSVACFLYRHTGYILNLKKESDNFWSWC